MTDPFGWQAHVTEDPMTMSDRLFVWRRRGDNVEVVVGFTDSGDAIIAANDPETTVDFAGLRFPAGALAAIARTVNPGPSQAEVSRVEEALTVERGRVDRVLAALLGTGDHPT